MVRFLEITLSDAEKNALWQEFSPLLEAGELKAIINQETPSVAHLALKLQLMHFARQVFSQALSEETRQKFASYKDGAAEILILNNMPERMNFASGKALPAKDEALIADLLSFMYAAVLGNNGIDNLRLDLISDSNDDNIHQDSLIKSGSYAFYPAHYVSLQSINPGQGNVKTLYMGLHDLIEQLPVHLREALQKPDFALDKEASIVSLFMQDVVDLRENMLNPAEQELRFQEIKDYYRGLAQCFNAEPAFKPLIVKEAGRWKVNEPFAEHYLFSSGILPNLWMKFRHENAKATLVAVRKERPAPGADSVIIDWVPGRNVIARQAGLYHRRYAPEGGGANGRCLNRARFYASCQHGQIVPGTPGMDQKLELSGDAFRAQLLRAFNDCKIFAEHEQRGHHHERKIQKAWNNRRAVATGGYDGWAQLLHS